MILLGPSSSLDVWQNRQRLAVETVVEALDAFSPTDAPHLTIRLPEGCEIRLRADVTTTSRVDDAQGFDTYHGVIQIRGTRPPRSFNEVMNVMNQHRSWEFPPHESV